jgi:aspartokinase/homoserine dehydrogenase 1
MNPQKTLKKIVVKFGGSNLKTKEDFSKLIQVISLYPQPIVIVISALYGITDLLARTLPRAKADVNVINGLKQDLVEAHRQIIECYVKDSKSRQQVLIELQQRVEELGKYLQGIHYLGEIPDFVEDRVLSYGERLSSLVLTAILPAMNIPCCECLPETLGLFTNGEYRNASVDFSLSEKAVRECLSGQHITVVPGFYGIAPNEKVTLLGRGGSDYTAAAIARCIDAESVDLWKDVPGFMSADPKVVSNPRRIDRLTYSEAAELSYFGARIIHPRTFEPVLEKKIPVRLFDIHNLSGKLEPVTVIQENGIIKKEVIKSVTFSDDFGVLKLHGAGVGIKPGIMARVTTALNDEGINIKSIITSQTCINILVARNDLARGLKTVRATGLSAVERVSSLGRISLIAVVGEGILEKPGIAARVLGAVSSRQINVCSISAGASSVTIYFIIARSDREKAIQSIHQEIFASPADYLSGRAYQPSNGHAALGYII